MSEIYIEQISTETVYFENEYLGEVPAGYYIPEQNTSQSDKENLSNLDRFQC